MEVVSANTSVTAGGKRSATLRRLHANRVKLARQKKDFEKFMRQSPLAILLLGMNQSPENSRVL